MGTSRASAPRGPRSRLTIAEVCDDLGISRSTFYDWRAKGRAPRCIKLPNGPENS
jgi:predicted DNA-binding transcriptional regulator AlpA